uniref:Uncharacterized protein n=1 Tax=Callorhinchus milii TaxID=7868 RepID=A0A4W3I353_CALMI
KNKPIKVTFKKSEKNKPKKKKVSGYQEASKDKLGAKAVNNVLPEVTTEDYVPGENYYEIIEETPRPSVSAGVNENVEEEYKEESLTGEDYDIDKKEIEEKKQDAKEYGVDEYEFKEYDVSEHDLREYDPNEYNVNYGDEYYYEIKEYEDSESTSNSTAREFGPGVPAETEFGSTAVHGSRYSGEKGQKGEPAVVEPVSIKCH